MNLSNQQLKQIIREELENVLKEEKFTYERKGSMRGKGTHLVTGGGLNSWATPASGTGQTSDLDRGLKRAGYSGVADLVSKANEGDKKAKRILKNLSEQFPL